MSILDREDELHGWTPKRFSFWRGLVVYFCVFSVVGHWIEIPYCLFNDHFFGIVDDNSLVFRDPMYPFLVYGVATVVCTLVLVPLKIVLLEARPNVSVWRTGFSMFVITVLVCMFMELAMGLLLNQPDPVTGVYPLWDNSQLPGNILGQAWIVNDILLGALGNLYVWVIYPLLTKFASRFSERTRNIVSLVIVVAFVVLCAVKF